jgi:hypothetical protein
MKPEYATPCPCGLHHDDTPELWSCDGCIETGVVRSRYALDYLAGLLRDGKLDKAAKYADQLEFVDDPPPQVTGDFDFSAIETDVEADEE